MGSPFLGAAKKKISPFHGRKGEIFTTRVGGTRGDSEKMIKFRRCLKAIPLFPKITFWKKGYGLAEN